MPESIDRHRILDGVIRRFECQITADARDDLKDDLKKLEKMRQELDQLPPDADLKALVQQGQLEVRVAVWDTFERAVAFMKSETERIGKLRATHELTEEELRHEREKMISLMDSMHNMMRQHFGWWGGADRTDEE